ncbi:MAG: hypothetical protein WCG91_02785 [Candidatus Shapirobacteria bacterium]
MSQFNIKNSNTIDQNYQLGFLPQRNDKDLFYQESSCRSNLSFSEISSENRRILRKTENFTFQKIALNQFEYTPQIQKEISSWIKKLEWDFPTSSVKTIFTNHIFNYVYVWKNEENKIIAYTLCYFSPEISHVAYVFYDPEYSHGNLPIRLVLQVIIDSQSENLKYSYLGRFSKENGYYKRNMPGFEYFNNNSWTTL